MTSEKVILAKASIRDGTMSQARWDKLTPEERREAMDASALHPCLIGYEGKRVRVTPSRAFGMSTFRVGRTTGWRPVHLAMRGNARGSSDTISSQERIDTVTVLSR